MDEETPVRDQMALIGMDEWLHSSEDVGEHYFSGPTAQRLPQTGWSPHLYKHYKEMVVRL